ncbi:hypothetical protein KKA00_10405 [bacterium]|nr:hypothetical protein [bacterium]MBU1652622.1 hypothetical protein [bacterium]
MEEKLKNLMQKAALGELSPDERLLLNEAIKDSPELQAELTAFGKVSALVKESAADSFEPFFATRVLQRVKAESEGGLDLAAALGAVFRKVVIGAAVVIIGVTSYNVTSQWDEREELSAVELAFNVPSLTIDNALNNIVGTP